MELATMEPATTTMEPATMEPATMEPTTMEPLVVPPVEPPVMAPEPLMQPVATDSPEPARMDEVREGRVRISLVPWGEVWVGERYMGRAPLELRLPQGSHSIRIGMGRPTRTERIRVVADSVRDLEFVFAE
jgi:hypothetical protein